MRLRTDIAALFGLACAAIACGMGATWVGISYLKPTMSIAYAAAEKITYLFPAPPILPAFGPIQLAQGKGYFTAAGLDVSFAVGLGGIVADGPIMVRGNGVPVKIVAVFGGKGFMQLVVREDSGIEKPADLKGK